MKYSFIGSKWFPVPLVPELLVRNPAMDDGDAGAVTFLDDGHLDLRVGVILPNSSVLQL